MIGKPRTMSVVAAACLILIASAHGPLAQESKTLGGRVIGEAEWQIITPAASEFEVTNPQSFTVRKKEFPQRYQEQWLDRRSTRAGARLYVFYERTNRGAFTTRSFERSFEQLMEQRAESYGVDDNSIRYEKLNRAFRLAFLPHGAAHCAVGMRIFGVSQGGHTSFSGDRLMRITVCKLGARDDELLTDTVVAAAGAMRQDNREPKLTGLEAGSYEALTRELFGQTSTSQPTTTAPRDVVGWERRKIDIDWDGNPELKTGTIFIRDDQTHSYVMIRRAAAS